MSLTSPAGSSTTTPLTSSISSTLSGTLTTTSASDISSILTSSSPPATTSNNSNPGTTSSLATSAALYLYTFLATLVLLLSVSAAIVIRSYVLRRRHRLMVEEAIRNGTWVPPPPPGPGRPKVDLTKKPKLWEVYLGGAGTPVGSFGNGVLHKEKDHTLQDRRGSRIITASWRSDGTGKEWDSIQPASASYVMPLDIPGDSTMAEGDVNEDGTSRRRRRRITMPTLPTAASLRPPPPRVMLTRVMNALNPTPVHTSPLPASTNAEADNAQGEGANTIAMTQLHHKKHLETMQTPTPVRVTVMIAMPTPPSTSSPSNSVTHLHAASSSSPNPMSTMSSGATRIASQAMSDDDEKPLPHIEMGVAEVLVMPRIEEGEDAALMEGGEGASRESESSEA